MSTTDTNKHISFPIQPSEIDSLFDELDVDHNNSLSPEETIALFKLARIPPPTNRQLQQFFQTVDTNHDGAIQKEEFHKYIFDRQNHLLKLFRQISRSTCTTCQKETFNSFKLRKFALHSGITLSDRDAREIMKQLDLNGNNQVSFSELCEALLLVPDVSTNTRAFIDTWLSSKYPPSLGAMSGGLSPFESIFPTRMNPPFLLKFLLNDDEAERERQSEEGIVYFNPEEQQQKQPRRSDEEKSEGDSCEYLAEDKIPVQGFCDVDETFRLMAEELDCSNPHHVVVSSNHFNAPTPSSTAENTIAQTISKVSTAPTASSSSSASSTILSKIVSGGVAGCIGKTASAPLEIWRIKSMTSTEKITMKDTFRMAMADGRGMKGLFVGNGLNMIKAFPEMSIRLASFDVFRSAIAKDPLDIRMHERLIAGGLSGMLSQVSIYNIEVVRTRMMSVTKDSYYYQHCHSFLDCAKAIIQKEGYRALFCGLSPSLIGILPYSMIDLAVNDFLKERAAIYLSNKKHRHQEEQQRLAVGKPPTSFSHSPLILLGCGMLSSLCAITCTHPLNVVRTRSQASGVSARTVARELYLKEGARGLFRGYAATTVKVLPMTGITYMAYDQLSKWF